MPDSKREAIDALREVVEGDPQSPLASELARKLDNIARPTTAAEALAVGPGAAIDISSIRDQVPLPMEAPRELIPSVAPARVPAKPRQGQLDGVIRDLERPKAGDRWWAVRRLMSWPQDDPRVAKGLHSALADPDPVVSSAAAMGLAARNTAPPADLVAYARSLSRDDEYLSLALFAAAVSAAWERDPTDLDAVSALLDEASGAPRLASLSRQLSRTLASLPARNRPPVIYELGEDA
jgi:hypothetical protein